jgi:choline-sulfatase
LKPAYAITSLKKPATLKTDMKDCSPSTGLDRYSITVLACTASAVFASVVMWLADCLVMIRLGLHPPGALYLLFSLALLLFAGVVIALVEWVVLRVSLACAEALCSRRGIAFTIVYGVFIAMFLTPGMLVVSIRLFSGAGIARWRWAPYGPWAAFLLSFVLVVFAAFLCVIIRKRWGGMRRLRLLFERVAIIVALSVAALLIAAGNLYVYPDLYGYLHFAATFVLFVICQFIFGITAPLLARVAGGRVSWERVMVPLLAVIVLSQLIVFPLFLRSNRARVFAWQQPYYHRKAVQAVRWIWDFDRDGFSPVLGGGDPCDWNAGEMPFAFSQRPGEEQEVSRAVPVRDETLEKDIQDLVNKTRHYNILLISVDALRGDRLTGDRASGRIAPRMGELRDRSVFFTRCFAPSSYTVLSMGGMFFSQICPWSVAKVEPSLAERLGEAGYHTIRVVNPAMRSGKRLHYLARGFDREIFAGRNRWAKEWAGDLMDGALRESAVQEIQKIGNEKFFMWVHFEDLHEWPYLSASVYPGPMDARDKYDYILSRTDEEVGRLLKALDENGIAGRTVVILTADHGQGLGEHNIMTHTQYLYQSLIHVPLIVYVPGVKARRVRQNVTLLDVNPTLLGLAGVPVGSGAEGISLLPCLVGGSIPENRPIVAIEARQRSVIRGPWKLIITPEAMAVELFNIRRDWEERTNLSHDGALKTLKEELLKELEPYAHISVEGPVR